MSAPIPMRACAVVATELWADRQLAKTFPCAERLAQGARVLAVTLQRACLSTRFGPLTVVVDQAAVTALEWGAVEGAARSGVMQAALAQLAAYDQGRLQRFDLPLRPGGGPALTKVLDAIRAIPFGETLTYGEIAKATGLSAQSVGQCCGANPIPVIIPCHRVMGAKGLTGFSGAGGVETKVALLRHEGAGGFLI